VQQVAGVDGGGWTTTTSSHAALTNASTCCVTKKVVRTQADLNRSPYSERVTYSKQAVPPNLRNYMRKQQIASGQHKAQGIKHRYSSVFVRLHLGLFPAGGPFLPSLSVNTLYSSVYTRAQMGRDGPAEPFDLSGLYLLLVRL
jgi:hypothetical protein